MQQSAFFSSIDPWAACMLCASQARLFILLVIVSPRAFTCTIGFRVRTVLPFLTLKSPQKIPPLHVWKWENVFSPFVCSLV